MGVPASLTGIKKQKETIFCGMEKCSRKRSITRLPPGGSSVAHCHFPRVKPGKNPSERSVPWKPHPHATPFYTVECTCKLVTNYIFHNPLFGPKSTRGLLLRAGLSLSWYTTRWINPKSLWFRVGNRCHPLCCLSGTTPVPCCHGKW